MTCRGGLMVCGRGVFWLKGFIDGAAFLSAEGRRRCFARTAGRETIEGADPTRPAPLSQLRL
ncbi:MAG: hypothetical protein MPL62_05680 [Alphaproteobacteria bacterium]|nr:hypothetical protein [Alphaproteobacteria bacterium]